jgi:hypothetical protein
MDMNWAAVGAIAEAIGVIAIFVSLIYVAVQIRQNTQQISRSVDATDLAAFERNIDSGNGIRELLILNRDLAELFLKGLDSFNGLDGLEKFRFGLLLRNMFSSAQGGFIRQLTVRHNPQDSEGIGGIIDGLLVNHGAREWLEKNTLDWRPEFQKFVDERLAAIEAREQS